MEVNKPAATGVELLPFTIPEELTRGPGRPLDFTPEQLANKFVEFLEWTKVHPIPLGETTVNMKGESFDKYKNAPRMVSIRAFLVYLGKSQEWWSMLNGGKRGDKFLVVKTRIREYCENYQIEMASTGLFKENIVSRLLGLADKTQTDATINVVERPEINIG